MTEPAVPSSGEGGLVRLRLDLAYEGTEFAGWAVQPGRRTVQGEVEGAFATVLRLPQAYYAAACDVHRVPGLAGKARFVARPRPATPANAAR